VTSVLVDTFGHGARQHPLTSEKDRKASGRASWRTRGRYACAAVVGNDSESVEAKDLHDFGRRN
jgi:hypothetical protein